MTTQEPQKPGFNPVTLFLLLWLGIGLILGMGKLFTLPIRRNVCPAAQNMVASLARAIPNFRSDYGRWPVAERERYQSDATLLVNLMGKDTRKNKRGRNYLDTMPMAKSGERRCGILQTGDQAELFDPWGNYFVIAIDHDNDGWVDNPEGASPDRPAKLNLKVAVVSPGPDGVLSGKNREGKDATLDNSRSW